VDIVKRERRTSGEPFEKKSAYAGQVDRMFLHWERDRDPRRRFRTGNGNRLHKRKCYSSGKLGRTSVSKSRVSHIGRESNEKDVGRTRKGLIALLTYDALGERRFKRRLKSESQRKKGAKKEVTHIMLMNENREDVS